jgi:hypothetical protein
VDDTTYTLTTAYGREVEVTEGRRDLTHVPTWTWTHPVHGTRLRFVWSGRCLLLLYVVYPAADGAPETYFWTGGQGISATTREKAQQLVNAFIMRSTREEPS